MTIFFRKIISVRYQPIVHLHSSHICGLEVLSRFKLPIIGFINPSFVFRAAALFRISHLLSVLIIKFVKSDILDGRLVRFSSGQLEYLSLNVLKPDLSNKYLIDNIINLNELLPSKLKLVVELVEDDYLDIENKALMIGLSRLRCKKIFVALDDFGKQCNSYREVMRVNPDIIKIDRDLLTNIPLIESLNKKFQRMGFIVVIEGIEDLSTAMMVNSIGFTYAQGYYFYRPLEI